jgi:predicted aconitase with swiveling domain
MDMSQLDSKIQIRVSDGVQKRVKVIAASRGITVTDLVLEALKKGDKELASIIEKEDASRNRPGRPVSR